MVPALVNKVGEDALECLCLTEMSGNGEQCSVTKNPKKQNTVKFKLSKLLQ